MNITATLTSKGQVTIPQAIRKALGLDAGMRLSFQLDGGELRVSPLPSMNWQDLWATAEGAPRPKAPVVELAWVLKSVGWNRKLAKHIIKTLSSP